MNKYCRVRLVNILTPETPKNRSKLRDFNSSKYLLPPNNLNKAVKREIKTGNVSSKSDSCKFIEKDAQTANRISEDKTRSSSRVSKNSQPKEHLNKITDMGFEQTDSLVSLKNCSKNRNRFETGEKSETKARKRRYSPEEKKDVLPLLKKPCNIQNEVSNTCNTTKNTKIETINKKATEKKEGNQEKRKRRKKKGSKTLWENKLTGAKRVSKRLTNLKIKNKILDKLQSCIDTDNTSLRNKKLYSSVSGVDKKIRRMSYDNDTKNQTSNVIRKSVFSRSSQQNLLGQNKKSYTKIPSNRKISTSYRVKVKPPSSTSNMSYTRKPLNIFIEYSEPEYESVNSTSSDEDETSTRRPTAENATSVNEDIPRVDGERNQDLKVDSSEKKILGSHSDTDVQCQVNEPQNLEIVESSKEDTLNTVVYDIEEECIDSSEVIIVDLESGKSILYEHAENCQITNAGTKDDCQTYDEKEPIFEKVCQVNSNKEDSDDTISSSKEKVDSLVENQSETENSVVTNVINIESGNNVADNGISRQGKTKNAEVILDESNTPVNFVK